MKVLLQEGKNMYKIEKNTSLLQKSSDAVPSEVVESPALEVFKRCGSWGCGQRARWGLFVDLGGLLQP